MYISPLGFRVTMLYIKFSVTAHMHFLHLSIIISNLKFKYSYQTFYMLRAIFSFLRGLLHDQYLLMRFSISVFIKRLTYNIVGS